MDPLHAGTLKPYLECYIESNHQSSPLSLEIGIKNLIFSASSAFFVGRLNPLSVKSTYIANSIAIPAEALNSVEQA